MTEAFSHLYMSDVFFRAAYQLARLTYSPGQPPAKSWVRGDCPKCGGPVIGNAYATGDSSRFRGMGYVFVYECWQTFGETPRCDWADLLVGARRQGLSGFAANAVRAITHPSLFEDPTTFHEVTRQ